MNVNDLNPPPASEGLSEWTEFWRARVQQGLEDTLPPADTRPAVVHEAMRYAALNGGKRLRALLCLAACDRLSSQPAKALKPALALEIFHASTLVHDDLPCMDDDELRRGQPATHIRFGEANALLAGNGMLTLALEWMASVPVPPPHAPGQLVIELARAGGSQGVIGGQIEDLAMENTPPDEDSLLYIHHEKTARLMSCACRCGAIVGGACSRDVERLGDFGLHLGMAFQFLDDVLDATQDTDTLGKPAGSDAQQHKMTSVALWGIDGARERAKASTDTALERLDQVGGDSPRLQQLALWMLQRTY